MKLKHVGIIVLSLSLVLGLDPAIGQGPGPNSPPAVVKVDADGPLAVVIGPEQIMAGQSAWFKTTGSQGATFIWDVTPPEARVYFTELPIYGGRDADGEVIIQQWGHFESMIKGTYYFALIVVEDNKVSVAKHRLVNGEGQPDPNPDPDPNPGPDPNPTPTPVINVPEPSSTFKSLVAGITPLITGDRVKVDSVELAMYYMDFADIIERDTTIIKETGDILSVNQKAGQLMFQKTGIQGRYTNLGFTIDKVFVNTLGLDNVVLTDAKRKAATNASRAVAWACLEANK